MQTPMMVIEYDPELINREYMDQKHPVLTFLKGHFSLVKINVRILSYNNYL